MIIDVLLPVIFDNPQTDVDVTAERLRRELGLRFVSGAMIAQLVRFNFAPLVSYRVTADGLRVRDAPSVPMGIVVGKLMRGDVIEALDESGDWVKHGAGWSAKAFLERVEK